MHVFLAATGHFLQVSEHRQTEAQLDFRRGIYGVADPVQQQREHDADQQRDCGGNADDLYFFGRIRDVGDNRRIHHASNSGLQVPRNICFFESRDEHVIELLVALRLALEHAKLEFLAIYPLNLGFALTQRALQRQLIGTGDLVLSFDADNNALDLTSHVVPR